MCTAITRGVAAMDSCFALIRAHQHGIAVGLINGGNPRVSKTLYAEVRVKGLKYTGLFPLVACQLSPSKKKKKKTKWRMDHTEGIACPTSNGTSHLTFDRRRLVISWGFKRFFDMRFWMYYSERTDTQFALQLLIKIKFTETDKIGYSRLIYIQIGWKQDDAQRLHKDWEGWTKKKIQSVFSVSMLTFFSFE